MEPSSILQIVGQVAGIGGLALGVFLIVFRELIRRIIFPDLGKIHAYRIIRMIVIATFLIAALGIVAWVYVKSDRPEGKGPVVRLADVDGAVCLPLPPGVRVTLRTARAQPQEATVANCEAQFTWAYDWQAGQSANIEVVGANSFERVDPARAYRLGDAQWVVVMRPVSTAPRLIVQLFDYATSEQGPEQLAQFHTIVRNKIQMLAQSLSLQNPQCKYVADLRVERTKRQLASSPNATLAEWRNSGSLLFLSGLFFRHQSDVMVRSQPYFGELGGEADISSVQIDLRINADEFGQTTDSHSLALLYALAMDARRRGQPNDVVLVFLGEAVSTALGLDSKVPGVTPLKNALRDALKGIGAPVPENL